MATTSKALGAAPSPFSVYEPPGGPSKKLVVSSEAFKAAGHAASSGPPPAKSQTTKASFPFRDVRLKQAGGAGDQTPPPDDDLFGSDDMDVGTSGYPREPSHGPGTQSQRVRSRSPSCGFAGVERRR